jgi:hypothetical protein
MCIGIKVAALSLMICNQFKINKERLMHAVAEQTVIYDREGQDIIFRLPKPGESGLPSGFAFSLHKAGSTLLFNMLRGLCELVGLQYVSIMDEAFIKGFQPDDLPENTYQIFSKQGYFYGGFRFLPKQFTIPGLEEAKKIFLIRDPRDILVSFYFSVIKSHIIPEKGKMEQAIIAARDKYTGIPIDDFVIDRSDIFLERMVNYRKLFGQYNLRIYRYEDVIYKKMQWAEDILEYFKWPVAEEKISSVVNPLDIIPENEKPDEHIRQVHPRNYLKKLKPATISILTEKFKPFLKMFSYQL